MDLTLTDDQLALQSELRRALGDKCDADARRAAMSLPGGVDRAMWGDLAQMGVFSICLPESEGGVGLGLADASVVFEELGRAAVPGPLVASFLAAGLVNGAAEGSTVVGMIEPAAPIVVEHLDALDSLVVIGPNGLETIDPGGLDGSLADRPLDPLTPVTFVDSELPAGQPVGDAAAADAWRERGSVLVAALQVGLGAASVDLGAAYAKERHQFGRPIGSFQAVKHMLADAFTWVEVARAGVHAAAVAVDEGHATTRAVHGARAVASSAAQRAAETCIQVHGGIGYTWELHAHLFLKRSLVLDTALGGVGGAVEEVAAAL